MKFGWRQYLEPTPKKLLKIGLAFKGLSTTSVPVILSGSHMIGIVMLAFGLSGEFLISFFGEDKENNTNN